MTTDPRVSIVTVAFNAADTIADCLQSVAEQTLPTEHIVVDGASSDATLKIVDRFSHVACVVSEPDDGLYDAINKGLSRCTGEVVGILNADDVLASRDVLETIAQTFADPAVDLSYGDLVYTRRDDLDEIRRHWRAGIGTKGSFRWGWMPPHPTFYVRRAVYEQHGGYRLDLGTAADYELMLRFMVRLELEARYIPKLLVRMREGGASNRTLMNRLLANRNDRLAWRVNGLRAGPFTLFAKPLRKLPQFLGRRR